MTNRDPTLAFKDVDTLFSNTNKILLAFRGSIIYYYLHVNIKNYLYRFAFLYYNIGILINKY